MCISMTNLRIFLLRLRHKNLYLFAILILIDLVYLRQFIKHFISYPYILRRAKTNYMNILSSSMGEQKLKWERVTLIYILK